MAQLRFFQGSFVGRLGELVGSRWKGRYYIKVYTPPANPKTPKQIRVRELFKTLSKFASALCRVGAYKNLPRSRRITPFASTLKANRHIYEADKQYDPAGLQVSHLGIDLIKTETIEVQNNTNEIYIDGDFSRLPELTNHEVTGLTLHTFAYNSRLSVIDCYTETPCADTASFNVQQTCPSANKLNTSDWAFYLFFTARVDGKRKVSKTRCTPWI